MWRGCDSNYLVDALGIVVFSEHIRRGGSRKDLTGKTKSQDEAREEADTEVDAPYPSILKCLLAVTVPVAMVPGISKSGFWVARQLVFKR
jgi:hypothetical protein